MAVDSAIATPVKPIVLRAKVFLLGDIRDRLVIDLTGLNPRHQDEPGSFAVL